MSNPPNSAAVEAMARALWRPYSELEAMPWDQRPGRIFARFTGWKSHSGGVWSRDYADLCFTRKDEPFCVSPDDRARAMKFGDMDDIDGISGWMPATIMLGDLVTLTALCALHPGVGAIIEGGAAASVLGERSRQVAAEGFDASYDDMATRGQLAIAAACYALSGADHPAKSLVIAKLWPWDREWWRPTDRRRDLVKAGALILAEIERLDRATPPSPAAAEGA